MKLTKYDLIALPPRILVLKVVAPDFLSVLDNLVGKLIPTRAAPQALVISLRRMVIVEPRGLRALETGIGRLRAHGIKVLLVEASARVRDYLETCRLLEALGGNSYYDNFAAAVVHCHTLNGGVGEHRMLVVDAYAESMLNDSCGYFQAPSSA
jgi:anti-anti-sigma regulatory factor